MIYGWDIGGAHIKCVVLNAQGHVQSVAQVPCTLWQGMEHLRAALSQLLHPDAHAARHAVTMTGELVDLFPTRAEGVERILHTFTEVVGASEILVFDGNGFVDAHLAVERWRRVASANWRATAALVALLVADALILDIGSTTTDITLIAEGSIIDRGDDDYTRLTQETLIYTGVVRTPLMAIAPRVPFNGDWVGVAAEYFATMGDVYRITEQLASEFDHAATADNQPKTKAASARRLARMIGCDAEQFPEHAWLRLAKWYAHTQVNVIRSACDRQLSQCTWYNDGTIIGLGVGAFLAQRVADLLQLRYLDFAVVTALPGIANRDALTAINVCGPAFALARLLHLRSV